MVSLVTEGTPVSSHSRRERVASAVRGRAPALVGYVLVAALTVGWTAISHPATVCACVGNADPAQFMWSFQWWPYAISHGLNPFVSHVIWAPYGLNLATTTAVPTLAIAVAPITALFGPIVAYNVVTILSPALTAFTTYLLCRRITGREWPSVAGGYLFGFGTYEITQLVAHVNLFAIFLLPLMVHVALRRYDGDLSRRAFVIALGALFVLQLGISSEMLATSGFFGLVVLVTATLVVEPARRPAVRRLIAETFGAGLLAIVVASPFLYYALVANGVPSGPSGISDVYGLDLLNPFFPTRTTWLFNETFSQLANTFEDADVAEADAYLSLPLIIAFIVWYLRTPRRVLAKLCLVTVAASLFAALGSHMHVAGFQTLTLPYDWIRSWPVVSFVTPGRLVMYTTLAIAVAMAAWLAEPGGRRSRALKWLTIGLVAVLTFPNLPSKLWASPPTNPAFFATSLYRRYIARGEMLLVLPYGADDNSMLWQAETNFYFSMPEGYLGPYGPPQYDNLSVVGQMGGGTTVPDTQEFLAFLRMFRVRHIAIDQTVPGMLETFLQGLGFRGLSVGGVELYRVPGD